MVSGASIMKQTMPWSEVSEQALHCIRILQTLCPHIPLSLSPNHPPFCFRSQMAFAHLHLLLPFVTGKFLCKQWKAKTTPDSNQHTHTKFDSKANFELCHQVWSLQFGTIVLTPLAGNPLMQWSVVVNGHYTRQHGPHQTLEASFVRWCRSNRQALWPQTHLYVRTLSGGIFA